VTVRAYDRAAVSDATPESVHAGEWPSWEDQLGEACDLDLDALFDDDDAPASELEPSLSDDQF
jgi:hypothetical protein